ncbi:hypothetical protein [Micromonospora sp. NPDC093244]|uniref:hypothetical protein n=1 Tax=Micromonospora sp. NPDC093244 TaxID=3155071 RepID=UPI0034363BA2
MGGPDTPPVGRRLPAGGVARRRAPRAAQEAVGIVGSWPTVVAVGGPGSVIVVLAVGVVVSGG